MEHATQRREEFVESSKNPLTIYLNDIEKMRITGALATLNSPYEDFDFFLYQCRTASQLLDYGTFKLLKDFTLRADAPGGLLLKNLPFDPEIPSNPKDGLRVEGKRTFFSEGILGIISSILGDIYSYTAEKRGELIHNVVPLQKSKFKKSNEGSATAFELHNEVAFYDFRPDFLALTCLREGKSPGYTRFCNGFGAISSLDPEVLAVLRKPLFRIAVGESFRETPGQKVWTNPLPMISGEGDATEIRVYFTNAEAICPEAEKALIAFREAMDANSQSIQLKRGETLVVNNHKAAHGRLPYQANFDGRDRWLQRAYMRRSLREGFSQQLANSLFFEI